jgi:hypothetical protein
MQENRWFGWQEEEACVLEERQDDEKVIHSKALLLAETPPQAAEAGPSPRDKAAAFIVPEAVLPTYDDKDDDFQVTSALVYGAIALTPHVGCTGSAKPEQASMAGARQ